MWLRHEGRSSALLRSSKADLPQHSSRERVVCGGSLRTKPPIDLMPTNGSLKLFCPNQTRSGPSADERHQHASHVLPADRRGVDASGDGSSEKTAECGVG
jgi:hypothetical protein